MRKRFFCLCTSVMFLLVFIAYSAKAQVGTGQYALGTYDNLGPDIINVGNLNLMLDIPVLHKDGRAGTPHTATYFSEWSCSLSGCLMRMISQPVRVFAWGWV
jgi:hypothetical protein